MNKIFYWSLPALLITIAIIYLAVSFVQVKPARYAIYNPPSQLISGESSTLLLDTVNGKTWMLVDEIWRPVNKVSEEKMISGPDPVLEKAVMAEEVEKLKKEQGLEIDRLKSQYEERYNMLLQKIDAKPRQSVRTGSQTKLKIKHYHPKKQLKSSTSDYEIEEQAPDDGIPPGWVNDK